MFSTFEKLLNRKASKILPSHETAVLNKLDEFLPTNTTELSSLTRTMSRKSCILDPIPAVLLRDCYDVLLPVIMRIMNFSLDSSTIPTKFEEAVLTSIMKKDTTNFTLAYLRPFFNLRFISKATEKVVANLSGGQ